MDRKCLGSRPLNMPRQVRVTEASDGAPTFINGRLIDRWRIDGE